MPDVLSDGRKFCWANSMFHYDNKLNPCSACSTPSPKMWHYKSPKEKDNLYCWGVYCEQCRSHKATEVGRHATIEEAIDGWNSWN